MGRGHFLFCTLLGLAKPTSVFSVCVRASERAGQSRPCRSYAGTARGFPLSSIRLRRTEPPTPFQIQQACLSLLTKAPLLNAPLSTRDAWPQQAGLADGVVTHLEVYSRQYLHGRLDVIERMSRRTAA